MLTRSQQKRLEYVANYSIENIRDLSLLSLAYQKPAWRPVFYKPLWTPVLKTAIYIPDLSIVYRDANLPFVQCFNTLAPPERAYFARQCLTQIAELLSKMDYYVHGDLTVENIMCQPLSGHYQFYVIDRCNFTRPQYCDLRTLYVSIMELFDEPFPKMFDTFTSVYMFEPVNFIKRMNTI